MTNAARKGPLIAGLILIALGALFFLDIWYRDFSLWRFIGRYWPVILIIIGLRKLYLYFTWEDAPSVPENAPKE
jgi:hypothetical protein